MFKTVKTICLISLLFWSNLLLGQSDVTITQKGKEYILANKDVKVVCSIDKWGYVTQHYFAMNKQGEFKEIVTSFRPDYSQPARSKRTDIYNSTKFPSRYIIQKFQAILYPINRVKIF